MNGSGTIRVRKRDGSEEPMDTGKLAGAMWRAMSPAAGQGRAFRDAGYLADAIRIHLERTDCRLVTTDGLFAMALKVLHKVRMAQAAEALAVHRICRSARRQCLIVLHDGQSATLWDKSWLVEHVERSWGLGRNAARIVAGHVEAELLDDDGPTVSRRFVLERMNAQVAALGLAGAVPLAPATAGA